VKLPFRVGRGRPPPADPWHRVRVGLGVLALVMTVGVIGYRVLGLGLFDALYQTSITVTTVGFAEVGPPDKIDQSYRVFTLILVFFGVSGALYTLGVMVEALVEGSINHGFQLRKEQRMIDNMSGHMIITGAGRVGRAISHYVARHGAEVVIIDRADDLDLDHLVVTGEATDDETLRRAGIERASTLIAALDSDADNVYVTLSARAINPGLFIVARTNRQSNEPKFYQAGADRVVNPHEIGGSRMGALAMHPTLAEFLDEILHDESHNVRVGEVAIPEGAHVLGSSVGEVMTEVSNPPLLLAIRHDDHGYVPDPDTSTVLAEGDVFVVLGGTDKIERLRSTVER